MSVSKGKGPVFDPGLCRCCGTMKKCRVLNVEYERLGQKEVYSDMIMDCFGILLSHLEGKPAERLVCATCVSRLREAHTFRKQVAQCEEAYIQMKMYDSDSKLSLESSLVEGETIQFQLEIVKIEPEEGNDLTEVNDRSEVNNQSDGDNGADDAMDTGGVETCTQFLKDTAFKHINENSNSNDDLPLKCIAKGTKSEPKIERSSPTSLAFNRHKWWSKQHRPTGKPKLPISKVQELIRQKDQTYMIDTNVISIVENSFICPFKCRHNNLLCYYCGGHFNDPIELRDHTIAQHQPKKFKITDHKNMIKFDLTRIDCRLCPAKIQDLDTFKRHIVTAHGKKYYPDVKDSVLPFKLVKDDMRCAVCNAGFPYFHALNKHMNEHYSNYICETCGLGFVDSNRFVMHQARHEEGTYPCETCGKLFKSVYNRELHIDRVHKKRGRVYCPKCDVMLMSHPQKLKHLVEVHGEQPASLPCTYCEKVFDTRRNLTIHWRKEHLKDFRYDCQVCGQKFFTRFALTNHMPTHTGERNFKCKVCQKSYPRLKTLKEHMRIHTNDRRYRCHICGQAFIQNCSLKGHIKSQHPEYG